MKTSARNQFLGTVTQVKTGAVNDEVELEIAGGHRLVAIVTSESRESLGLQLGVQAYALIKASSVILMAHDEPVRVSARNCLTGTVSRVQPGAVNVEVVMELPGGASLVAVVTQASSEALQLAVGSPTTAIFKASSIILSLPA